MRLKIIFLFYASITIKLTFIYLRKVLKVKDRDLTWSPQDFGIVTMDSYLKPFENGRAYFFANFLYGCVLSFAFGFTSMCVPINSDKLYECQLDSMNHDQCQYILIFVERVHFDNTLPHFLFVLLLRGDFDLSNFEDGVISSAFMVGLLVASPIFASSANR